MRQASRTVVGQGSAGGRLSDDGTEGWTSVETDGQEADRWREDGASGRELCRKSRGVDRAAAVNNEWMQRSSNVNSPFY